MTVVGSSAPSPASRIAVLTWALAVSMTWVAPLSLPPVTSTGSRIPPDGPPMLAPMLRSGVTTLCIGRLDRLSSPVIRALTPGRPETSPHRVRAVVPELPASSAPSGERRPVGADTERVLPRRSTFAPACPRQRRVEAQSAPSEKLCTVIPSGDRAPSRAALCEIDLSPGRATLPETFRAGSTRFIATTPSVRSDEKRTGLGWKPSPVLAVPS